MIKMHMLAIIDKMKLDTENGCGQAYDHSSDKTAVVA
jgi:hypothetical protein